MNKPKSLNFTEQPANLHRTFQGSNVHMEVDTLGYPFSLENQPEKLLHIEVLVSKVVSQTDLISLTLIGCCFLSQ